MFVSALNKILAVLTIGGQLFLIAGALYWFVSRRKRGALFAFLSRNGLKLAFGISLAATVLSLFYSEVAGFAPCILCWYQRIFIYPQVVILGLAWFRNDMKAVEYALPLAVIGGIIALYHNYIDYGGISILPCAVSSAAVSCTKRYIFEFGYVTIPLMSLTASLLMIFFLNLQRHHNKTAHHPERV